MYFKDISLLDRINNQLIMGSQCCKVKQEKQPGSVPPLPPKPPKKGQKSLPITKSGLYISHNIENILSKSGKSLNCTFLPEDREYGDNSLVLAIGQSFNPKLFVRFYLIYSFYIARYNSNSKQTDFQTIFYNLASRTHDSQEQKKKLQQFKTAFNSQKNQRKKDLVVVTNVFTAKFIIENINQILLGSNDPKDIAHLIFPMARIFNGVKKTYHENRNKKSSTLYIIAQLRQEEKQIIKEMKGKQCCFSFSVFMKGFTVENHARKQFNKIKKSNEENKSDKITFFFTVNFPYKADKMESKYDYGFYVNPDKETKAQGDVLFNIMNSFKVVQSFSASEYDLEYGYLPYIYYAKYTDRTPNIDTSSIKVFDICQAISANYLKSQSCLFRIIRDGLDSLKLSQSIISQSPTRPNQREVLNEVQVENMINNYIDQSNFSEALALAQQYKSSFLIRAKKLQVLYKQDKYEQARKWLGEIGPAQGKQKKINQGEQIIQFISAKLLIHEGKIEKAKEKLKALHLKMITKYEGSYEVIGAQVLVALEELYGGAKDSPVATEMAQSQRQNKETIRLTQINLRGISTTI